MSRAIVVIREPLRSMLTPAGLKTAEKALSDILASEWTPAMQLNACDRLGIDVALCCEDGSCTECVEEAIAKKADDDDRAYDRERDRRAGL